jgi:hypothetical protein
MKKFLVILLTFLVMTSLFGIPTFAADDAEEAPAANVVMRVSGLKQDGTSVVIRDVENHNNDHGAMAEGWELAVDCADDDYLDDNGYDRIVVTFYADWKANSDGEFGESSLDGFRQSTIFVPSDTKITVNLNGHTIDRGLGDNNEFDGEVICIDDDADVMIENGTITGGNSDNGAGGIHIYDHSNVTLNNLTVKGNKTDDDDGAGIYIDCDSIVTLNNVNVTGNIANNGSGSGIAVYNGATLIMNGGSLSNNEAYDGLYCGALFVEDAEAILNNVTISGNKSNRTVVVYVVELNGTATATFNNCIIENNSSTAKEGGFSQFFTVEDGSLYINGGEIKNNGQTNIIESVFYCDRGKLCLTGTSDDKVLITGNNAQAVFDSKGKSEIVAEHCEITDNTGDIGGAERDGYYNYGSYTFTSCKFNNNNTNNPSRDDFYTFNRYNYGIVKSLFKDCDLGDTTFNNTKYIDFGKGVGAGSIFGEGSLTMIVSILALVSSVAAIGISLTSKKKAVPTTASNAKTEDEE